MVVAIDTLAVIAGRLPPRATAMVLEWASEHQQKLNEAWEQARKMLPPKRIDPLT